MKPGDKIIYIGVNGVVPLTRDKEYIVGKTDGNFIEVINDLGLNWWYTHTFILVNKKVHYKRISRRDYGN